MDEAERVKREWEALEDEYHQEVGNLLEMGHEEWEIYGALSVIDEIVPLTEDLYAPLLKEVRRYLTLIKQRKFRHLKLTDTARDNLSRELGVTIRRKRGRPVKTREGERLVRVYASLVERIRDRARFLVSVDMADAFSRVERKALHLRDEIEKEITQEGKDKVINRYRKDIDLPRSVFEENDPQKVASTIAYHLTLEERKALEDNYTEQVEEAKIRVRKLRMDMKTFVEDLLITALDRVKKPYAFLKALERELEARV